MKRGELSYSKVRALTRVAWPDTEQELVELGRAGTAGHVELVVRAWRRIDRTLEARDDELREASSQVTAHIDESGMYVIRGRLAPEAGEVLMKALQAAGDKLYAEQKQKDRPPVGKMRADALALVAESALKGGLDPGSSADRYQVVVHVNEAELETPGRGATKQRAGVPAGTPSVPESHAGRAAGGTGHVPAGTPAESAAQTRPAATEPTAAAKVSTTSRSACRASNGSISTRGISASASAAAITSFSFSQRGSSSLIPGCPNAGSSGACAINTAATAATTRAVMMCVRFFFIRSLHLQRASSWCDWYSGVVAIEYNPPHPARTSPNRRTTSGCFAARFSVSMGSASRSHRMSSSPKPMTSL